ncbi:AIPR family protein [Shewanella woodyi]|uniref:AIPR family protein n=1 Tax=Shewanella woodyi TaxID=60961 RepID=UPI003747EEE9
MDNKKGGTTCFRHFIELIESGNDSDDSLEINREFFEELISKMILFKSMEKIYGQGRNSLGQLRAAVIPYSLSIIYMYTDGMPSKKNFNLDKIWKEEAIDRELAEYLKYLMIKVNDLIKKYSASEDYNEYSRKPELWESIRHSKEVKDMMTNEYSSSILIKYSV